MDKRQPSRNAELGLSTRAIHHGYDPAEEHGALTPPIFMTSTYAFETAEAGSELFRVKEGKSAVALELADNSFPARPRRPVLAQ